MAHNNDLNLQEINDFLVSVAHDAGKMIVGARRPRVGGTGVKINCAFSHLSSIRSQSTLRTLLQMKKA